MAMARQHSTSHRCCQFWSAAHSKRTVFVQMAKVSMGVCDAEMRCEVGTWIRKCATRRILSALPRANAPGVGWDGSVLP